MYAINGPDWVELQPGSDVVIDGVHSSYETITIWSPQQRTAKGIKAIVDDPVPVGRAVIGSSLVDDDGKPRRVWQTHEPTLSERKVAMLAQLAETRWLVENSGIEIGGLLVPTDRDSQGMVDRIVKAFDDGDVSGTVDFKSGSGWVALGETEMRAIKTAGAQHIQACFSREKALAEAIEAAADHAALDAVDLDSGWPA